MSLEQHMRGIRVVEGLPAALTILTTYAARPEDRPYEDDIGEDFYPRYKWQGKDPSAYDNVSLRRAMELQKPLAWFRPIAKGVYDPVFPVWVVDEETPKHQVVLAINEVMRDNWQPGVLASPADVVRRSEYARRVVRVRLHQREFRHIVIGAYEGQCALCRLKHPELLDAAHIKEDSDGGQPVVTNGIAMCAIHHRAFDALVVGIRPNCVIEVRRDVLAEHDGPTLQHALQGINGADLIVPTSVRLRPDVGLLEERYERFRRAG
jgi:putative restriction endonuclease